MAAKYVGIDIGSYNIKIVNILVKKKKILLRDPVILRTPRFLVQNGKIAAKEEFIELMKGYLGGKRPREAVILLNDSLAVTREMELPEAPFRELEQMVRLDASEFLPSEISEYSIRYRILQPAKKGSRETNYILMAAARNDMVSEFYELFCKLGLKPASIDVSINSIIKYFKRIYAGPGADKDSEKVTAVLEMGASSVRLVGFQGAKPAFHQILNHSSQKIDILIANTLDIEREEAEKLKIQYGLSHLNGANDDEKARSIGSIINTQIDLMLNDVYKCFQSFISRTGQKQVQQLLLTGGMSGMYGLAEYIQKAFGIPCSVIEPGNTIGFSLDDMVDPDNRRRLIYEFPFYTNIIGGACRDL